MNSGIPIFASSLRPFWTTALNEISGNVEKGVGSWLSDEEFQIYSPVKSAQFNTRVADARPYLAALAADINRTASAAFESIGQAGRNSAFPRSTAWILIKSYYAAFFAAHALLRMQGTSFINLDKSQVTSLNKIARLYGFSQEDVTTGNYTARFDSSLPEVVWHRVESASGGVHEKFWSIFKHFVERTSTDLLKSKIGVTADNQLVAGKLTELVQNLCYDSCVKGTWLSVIRNRVNYKHLYGAWYPYRGQRPSFAVEERFTRNWSLDPFEVDLVTHGDKDLRRFQETCNFIISWCRVLAFDMAERCPSGKSFHTYGWLAISRLTQAR
jgi:hypothetical protein